LPATASALRLGAALSPPSPSLPAQKRIFEDDELCPGVVYARLSGWLIGLRSRHRCHASHLRLQGALRSDEAHIELTLWPGSHNKLIIHSNAGVMGVRNGRQGLVT
jgi:hypothetical protein